MAIISKGNINLEQARKTVNEKVNFSSTVFYLDFDWTWSYGLSQPNYMLRFMEGQACSLN